MLKLKNYMVASVIAVLTLFSFNLKAETKEQITVIFNGKAGGSYNARIGAGGNNGDANIPESVITLMEVAA